MLSSSIRIVLVGTTHPGNIGSTARAMKTMGLKHLYLVAPKAFPDPRNSPMDARAHEMAAGADDLVEQAIITPSLPEALRGCHLVMATSARPRHIALPGLLPAEAATLVMQQQETTHVAIVFGREHAGLTNEELLQCHYHIHIPSNPEYSSLNLAQAVQIIAYELRMKALSPPANVGKPTASPATADAVEQFYDHLSTVLRDIDFLKPSNPKRLVQRLRRLFNRIQLEAVEVNILRGMLSQIQRVLRKAEEP